MHQNNKRQARITLPVIYILLAATSLSVFRFSDMVTLGLLGTLVIVQILDSVLLRKETIQAENDAIAELNQLETSYLEKLNAMNGRLRKRTSAYRLLQANYKKLQKITTEMNEDDSRTPVPLSAYMLPHSGSEEEKVNLRQIAAEAVQELSSFSRAHRIRIQLVSVDEELFFTCSSDRMRILFRNIIDNAVKYMNRPGNLVITLSFIGDDIFIIFKDDGAGLPKSELAHIFELNYQGSNRTSGNGLGLAQAKAIVDYYHGTIFAKSSHGNGMAVYIQFPSS